MYKDILNQIVKYLQPRIVYYPILTIRKMYDADNNQLEFIVLHLYLICEINDKIELEIHIDGTIVDNNTKLSIAKFCNNENLYFLIARCEIDSDQMRNKKDCNPLKLVYIDKNMQLKIINPNTIIQEDNFDSFFHHSLDDYILRILKYYDPEDVMTLLSSHKLNGKSIELVKEGFKIISEIVNLDFKNIDKKIFTEKEKKYVKIYNYE